MIPDDPAQDDDDRWQALEDRADELTEQGRAELERRAQVERATAIDAMESHLENMPVRAIAELLWDERKFELDDPELTRPALGIVMADRTTLALWFKDAAKQWAHDNAERVTPEQLDAARRDEYVEIEE